MTSWCKLSFYAILFNLKTKGEMQKSYPSKPMYLILANLTENHTIIEFFINNERPMWSLFYVKEA